MRDFAGTQEPELLWTLTRYVLQSLTSFNQRAAEYEEALG